MILNSRFVPELSDTKTDYTGTVVFLHGTGASAEMWDGQANFLAEHGYQCILLDLRGHGLSKISKPQSADLNVFVSDVLETLDTLKIAFPVAFVGHSLGAIISVTIAEKYPELVSSLFAACLPGRVYKSIALAFGAFLDHGFAAINASKLSQIVPRRIKILLDTDPQALRQVLVNFEAVDFIVNPPRLQSRLTVHLASGLFDPIAPYHLVAKLHLMLPNSTLWSAPGAHNFMDIFPQQFNDWLLKGLRADLPQ